MESIDAARLLSSAGWQGPARVHIEGGAIASIEPLAATTSRRTLVPGFIDLQVNGIDDVDVSTAADADWERLDRLLLAQGVTT